MSLSSRRINIVTNLRNLACAATERRAEITIAADDVGSFARQLRGADLVIIDDDWSKIVVACLLRPVSRFRIVLVDLILRRPTSLRGKVARAVKRRLLARVDRFLFYFRDLTGYQSEYGIDPRRSVYIPFKVNGLEDTSIWPTGPGPRDHVLCAGRTLRDIDTFLAAMALTGLPGVLLQQDRSILEQHGTRPAGPDVPANVQVVIEPGGELASFLDHIARARLLVIPRFRGDMAATGISTYLDAMALGTAVVIGSGPGAEDVLDGQAVIVAPEDPVALADAIQRVWSDDELRDRITTKGRAYAAAAGGEQRLCNDILAASFECLEQ